LTFTILFSPPQLDKEINFIPHLCFYSSSLTRFQNLYPCQQWQKGRSRFAPRNDNKARCHCEPSAPQKVWQSRL